MLAEALTAHHNPTKTGWAAEGAGKDEDANRVRGGGGRVEGESRGAGAGRRAREKTLTRRLTCVCSPCVHDEPPGSSLLSSESTKRDGEASAERAEWGGAEEVGDNASVSSLASLHSTTDLRPRDELLCSSPLSYEC